MGDAKVPDDTAEDGVSSSYASKGPIGDEPYEVEEGFGYRHLD